MGNETSQPQMPQSDPALKRLESLVGTWILKGRTLDSEVDNFSGQTTFEWLPGGFFLKQTFKANFMGKEIQSLELIGYDPASDAFPSTVYSSLFGVPIAYKYDVRDNEVIITTDLSGGAKMMGKISEDGNTFSGGWRPELGKEGPGNVAYDFVGTRMM